MLQDSVCGVALESVALISPANTEMLERTVTVGKSKMAGSEGRTVTLSDTAWRCIQEWRSQWPDASHSISIRF
jgi:hypothetical protein